MQNKTRTISLSQLLCVLLLAVSCQSISADEHETMVFEMRTYTTFEGKLEALNSRFRDHTLTLFEKHGMKNIGYWIPVDTPNTLIYIVAHKSKTKAGESWKNFINDPDWKKVYAESIADGKLVSNIENVYMYSADYSSIHQSTSKVMN